MTWSETLRTEIENILDTSWDDRDGNVIPSSSDITLKNGAVKIDATFLYADLAGSSKIAQLCPWTTTAKIIRAYLNCCVRSIKAHDGEIRSFDGDRVMGIFKGPTKNINAVTCAREIDWLVEKSLNPKAFEKFSSIEKHDIKIRHCIGIDTGQSIAVRAGIRNDNDLIWIGRPPSFAAKLSDIRNHPYSVYITEDCYDKLPNSSKVSGEINIWEARTIKFADEDQLIYRTKYMLTP